MKPHLFLKLSVTLFIFAAAVTPARATISSVDMFRTNLLFQTGNGSAGTNYGGSYLDLDLYASMGNEFSSVSVSFPGPTSPVSLNQNNPSDATIYSYESSFFASQAMMDATFPTGTYTYNAIGGGNPSTSINYLSNAYSLSQPYLAGTTFSDLQGLNTAAPFALQLSPFNPDPSVDEADIFFTIFDTITGTPVFTDYFLPSTTTSINLPANTLDPGTAYTFDLVYSDRLFVDSPGADFDAVLAFDVRTDGSFTTAV